ncbi:hypothetical protein GCM10023216_27910 [Isoptericola chiayiensis]|uniref:Uncharacterized protein n=1 Tax=Isoptericola chiayiensis TaxID=579446 RepID=A0ABP8YPJ1_9MICO
MGASSHHPRLSGARAATTGCGPGQDGPMTAQLWITGDDATDRLLSEDPFALLVGMLLDQSSA